MFLKKTVILLKYIIENILGSVSTLNHRKFSIHIPTKVRPSRYMYWAES